MTRLPPTGASPLPRPLGCMDGVWFACIAGACIAVTWWRRDGGGAGGTRGSVDPDTLDAFIAATQPWEWEYKAEGGANVTLSYVGHRSRLQGHLLRIRKRGKRSGGDGDDDIGGDPHLLPHDPLTYAQHTIRPRLGVEYVIPGVQVSVPTAWLRDVVSQRVIAHRRRPASRAAVAPDVSLFLPRHGGDVAHVVLMLDHSILPCRPPAGGGGGGAGETSSIPTLCVELKPKCGAALRHQRHGQPCRYCAHQVWKAVDGTPLGDGIASIVAEGMAQAHPSPGAPMPAMPAAEVDEWRSRLAMRQLSRYCPHHLFSGDSATVLQGVRGLLSTPQNNLRLFVDGRPVFTADHADVASATDGLPLLEAALASSGVGWSVADVVGDVTAALCHDPILHRIAALQSLDTRGARAVWLDAAAALVASGRAAAGDCSMASQVEGVLASLPHDHPLRREVEDYFIAATAKDCSILIALQWRGDGDDVGRGVAASAWEGVDARRHLRTWRRDGGTVLCSIAVVDVDPKPVDRLCKYAQLEGALEAAWCRALAAMRDTPPGAVGDGTAAATHGHASAAWHAWLSTRACLPPPRIRGADGDGDP